MSFEELISRAAKDRALTKAQEIEKKFSDLGMFWSELFGWEYPANIEFFGFTVDEALSLKGIPVIKSVNESVRTETVPEIDKYGNKTGRMVDKSFATGVFETYEIDKRYLSYVKWKEAIFYQRKANENSSNTNIDN